jgi:hypothetical protein
MLVLYIKKSAIKRLIYISLRTLLRTASIISVSYTKTMTEVTGFWDKQSDSEEPAASIISVNSCALIMEISQNSSVCLPDYTVSYSRR